MENNLEDLYINKICPHCGETRKVKRRFSNIKGKELAICEDYLNGMTYREIGRKYNTQFSNVGKILKANNVKPRPGKMDTEWGKRVAVPIEPIINKYV